MTKVTATEHHIKVIRYTWNCPGCGRARDESHAPGPDDFECYPCVLKREKEEWLDEYAFLIGSTVTDLQWTAGMGFRGLIVWDADGNGWAIRGPMTCERVTK